MEAASLARREGESARFVSFRQARLNQDLKTALRTLRVVETLENIRWLLEVITLPMTD
jgi:hypothetical protein